MPVAVIAHPQQIAVPAPTRGRRSASARVLRRLAFLSLIAAAVVAAPAIVPYAPEAQELAQRLQPPGPDHLLGTDGFGRDVVARLLAGGRISLSIGVLSMVISVVVGVLVGASAGYFGRKVDALLMRATELVMVFPTFFLIILIVASFGGSVALLVLVIGLTSWPVSARVIRGEVLKTKSRDFVVAARSVGAGSWRIIATHVLPNIAAVIIVSATIRVGTNILVEAGLSYLGLGVQPPLASWGNMIAEGSRVIRTEWWLVAVPASAIFVTVLGFNLLGEALRDALDPRNEAARR